MSDLISRSDFLKHLDDCRSTPPELQYVWPIVTAIKCFVEEMPTIDAVPVVRCKDCKRFVDNKEAFVKYCSYGRGIKFVSENDFCSYGERKNDEN